MRRILVGLAALGFATLAYADIQAPVVLDGPSYGSSYWVNWSQDLGDFEADLLVLTIESGDAFAAPAITNVNQTYSSIYNDASLAVLVGDPTLEDFLSFNVHYSSNQINSTVMNWYLFEPEQDTASAGWEIAFGATDPLDFGTFYYEVTRLQGGLIGRSDTIIPVPGAALLGVLGLGLVARVKRHIA